MDINHQAPIVARKEIFIQASPEVVWKLLADINAWSQWQPDVPMARLEGPLAGGSVFYWKGGGLDITSTLQVVEPGQKIGWTGKSLGTQARHIWLFSSQKNGTLVSTEESMEGWLPTLLKVIMPNFLEVAINKMLKSLKRRAEAGR